MQMGQDHRDDATLADAQVDLVHQQPCRIRGRRHGHLHPLAAALVQREKDAMRGESSVRRVETPGLAPLRVRLLVTECGRDRIVFRRRDDETHQELGLGRVLDDRRNRCRPRLSTLHAFRTRRALSDIRLQSRGGCGRMERRIEFHSNTLPAVRPGVCASAHFHARLRAGSLCSTFVYMIRGRSSRTSIRRC